MQQVTNKYDKLVEKNHQHEALIIQLMSIVAVTNKKVHELTDQEEERKKVLTRF